MATSGILAATDFFTAPKSNFFEAQVCQECSAEDLTVYPTKPLGCEQSALHSLPRLTLRPTLLHKVPAYWVMHLGDFFVLELSSIRNLN